MGRELDDAAFAEGWSSGPKGAGCPGDDRWLELAQGNLAAREVERLLDHTASCPDCALALRTATAIHDASGLAAAPAPQHPSLWSRLASTVFRPEAALAYLLLLAVTIPVYFASRPAAPPAPPVAALTPAQIVALEPETVARGESAQPPLGINVPADRALVLRLFVDRDDVQPGAPFEIELTAGARSLSRSTQAAAALDADGTLAVTLDWAALPAAEPIRLEVRSGTAVVFARTVVLTR